MRLFREQSDTFAPFQHDGIEYAPDADSVIEIPDELEAVARDQGFVDVPPPADASGSLSAAEIAAGAATVEEAVPTPATAPMRAPDHVSSVSHAGQEFVIPDDGIVAVPLDAVEAFRSMGFVHEHEDEPLVALASPGIIKVPASAVPQFLAHGFRRV